MPVNAITTNTSSIQKESSGCTQVEISFNLQFIIQTDTDDKTLSMVLDTVGYLVRTSTDKHKMYVLRFVMGEE